MSTISRLALASGAVMGILSAGPVSAAMTDVDCTAAYLAADTNNDGYISEAEGARSFAFYRVANKPVADGKLMRRGSWRRRCCGHGEGRQGRVAGHRDRGRRQEECCSRLQGQRRLHRLIKERVNFVAPETTEIRDNGN